MSLDLDSIRAAHERIRAHIKRTPVLTSSRLDAASGASLFFKCENFQKIGAFKARGATNAVFSLDDVTALLAPRASKLAGAIAGRALYDGRLDAAQALALLRQKPAAAGAAR